MTDLERRATLGDPSARMECNNKEITLPCPFCGAKPKVWCDMPKTDERGKLYSVYRVQCQGCGITMKGKPFYLTFNQETCSFVSTKTQKEDVISRWNYRRTIIPGRCKDCENTCPGKDGSYLVCVMYGHSVDSNDFCSQFESKEGKEK